MATTASNFAIQGHSIFEPAEGLGIKNAVQESDIEFLASSFFDTSKRRNTVLVQTCDPASSFRIGVAQANNHLGNPSINNGLRTRRRATVMIARFETDVDSRSSRAIACLFEGKDFSMGLTGAGVKALADNFAIFDHHRPHHWIWSRFPRSPAGQL